MLLAAAARRCGGSYLRRKTITATRTLSSSLDGTATFSSTSGSSIEKCALSPSKEKLNLDALLRSDVRTMGSMLGGIIQDQEGSPLFEKIETLRSLGKKWRGEGAGRSSSLEENESASLAFDEMSCFVSELTDDELVKVSRAFAFFLGIANTAEFHHRSRLNRYESRYKTEGHEDGKSSLGYKRDSCGGVLIDLLSRGVSEEAIYSTLTSQKVELVLTAHPTEVNRRTLLDKKRRMQELLTLSDNYRAMGGEEKYEDNRIQECLMREISSIWQTDEVVRSKPTPQEEASRGMLVVETVLWDTLPEFLRKLDETMKAYLGKGLPLTTTPVKLSSWMGGDRDGNPNVTPDVTREVTLRNRIQVGKMYLGDLDNLKGRLSIKKCNRELQEIVGEGHRAPYREFLNKVSHKLQRTIEVGEKELENVNSNATSSKSRYNNNAADDDSIYLRKEQLLDDLMLAHRSLSETGNEVTANGHLTDIIRRVSAFGLTLVPLDIRQESDRHTEALDCITRYLGLGSYTQWDEATRITWLQTQIASQRPLLRPNDWDRCPDIFTKEAKDTLETFQMIAEQGEDSLGAYVISQATDASDVLAVLMLQKDAGVEKPLRVVPLFETLDDLKIATKTMETLFTNPVYMGSIGGKQEVMIGYSDSAKDAGRLAASWAQFETQEDLAKLALAHNVDLTFFHGKGGTVGRGGNPATFDAILAHAPNTINSQFRVTEQGEMINQNFGYPDRAERTLNIYTAAILAEKHIERSSPDDEWRGLMERLSEESCKAYRQIVREDERFVPYFRSATPELELSGLKIGSRPAKRKATGGVESLRAIPWNFAWTQTRLNLPTWLGVGEAIDTILKDPIDGPKLHKMYNEWGSFRTTIDMVEMVLAKSEPSISKHYENMLVSDPACKSLGTEIQQKHSQTDNAILELSGHAHLAEDNKLLRRMLNVRNPYVDCLNVLQAETLKRLRGCEGDYEGRQKILDDALLSTISGIANGMGNTG